MHICEFCSRPHAEVGPCDEWLRAEALARVQAADRKVQRLTVELSRARAERRDAQVAYQEVR